jgi:ribosome-binding factor A
MRYLYGEKEGEDMKPRRLDRMQEIIKNEVASALVTGSDESLKLVNIFDVEVTNDMKYARIYYSIIGDADKEKIQEKLERLGRKLQGEISRKHRFRITPRFMFIYNDSLDRGFRVIELLKKISSSEEEAEDGHADTEE